MTLGLTSSGAIKIKTDGGTTTAVNCACCNTCGCGVAVPPSLREFADNATQSSISIFGVSPDSFAAYRVGYWWANFGGSFDPLGLCEIIYFDGCLYSGPYIEYSTDEGENIGLAEIGPIEGCEEEAATSGTFTINGEGEYPYYYLSAYPFVPPPNFVFNDPFA